jgi:importin subunit beta-1
MVPALEKMISLVGTPTTALPVRDTAAWTIARICEHHTASIQPQHWHVMLREGSVDPSGALIEPEGVLLMALKDHTRVAEKVCTALYALAEQVEDERNNPSNRHSGLFVTLAKALLACTERHDAGENNLRVSAYEALNMVITNAAKDTHVSVGQLLPLVISRLEGTFAMPIVSSDDREAQTELQGLLCATLQVITQKLGPQAAPHADQMMNLCLQVFASRNSSVHEEALLAVGSVATATGRAFEKYMPHFRPFLSLGLSNYEEFMVCNVAIGVVGDICRALEKQVMPYCDELVHLLLRNLQLGALLPVCHVARLLARMQLNLECHKPPLKPPSLLLQDSYLLHARKQQQQQRGKRRKRHCCKRKRWSDNYRLRDGQNDPRCVGEFAGGDDSH